MVSRSFSFSYSYSMILETRDSLCYLGDLICWASFLFDDPAVRSFSINEDIKLSLCLTKTFIRWFYSLSLALFIADLLSSCSRLLIFSVSLLALRSSCSFRSFSFFWLFSHFYSSRLISAFLLRYFVSWSKNNFESLVLFGSSVWPFFFLISGVKKLYDDS